MDIALIGGHGKVALHLIPLLNAEGHHVDAVIRNPQHEPDVVDAGADAVVADVETMDTDTLADLLRGHDLVIWSAGAGGGSPQRTYAVDRDAAIRSMDAASQGGVGRYLMVSYFGAGKNHGVPIDNSFYPYAQAKAEADEHLRHSNLNWTILAPSRLTDGEATGRIEVGGSAGSVSRADVAAVIAAAVERPKLTGSMIKFNSGPTPIAQALAT
ncbi:MAG: SDR family oxidoreductase [Actinobacteria bacterium]|nr:SDR family oxidoreductase [Actinomycetota bacterium]MCO5301473.1 SDR family oxidoreductase [Candidatus Nanopelagicales bacterium]HPE13709.1 SDR family oxidoreductase [Actinomycetota bacterium]HRV67442.1 SDR family oxidoreductase [Candidatus Nanopelagicales bacterium]